MNFLSGTVTASDKANVVVDLGKTGTIKLPRGGHAELVGKTVTVGMRPEHLSLDGGGFGFEVTPGIVERLGIHTLAYCTLAGGQNFVALFEGDPEISQGVSFKVGIDPAKCQLFSSDGIAVRKEA